MQNTVTALFGESKPPATATHRARVIAITSGKGGVGKTNITANLAVALALNGKRVCIIDADTGLANVNIVLGLKPAHTLEDFLEGGLPIESILMEGPRGVCVVPGASGIVAYADLSQQHQQSLLNGMQQLEQRFDYLLIDTAAGIADSVIRFVQAAERALLVVSPDPTSLTDAFALTRILKRNDYPGTLHLLVNMADSELTAHKVYQRFSQAVQKYIQVETPWFGHVAADRALVTAVRLQHPVILVQPDSPASVCLRALAERLDETCDGTPGAGLAAHLRSLQPEAAVDPVHAAIEMIRNAQPTQAVVHEANLGELHRQFIDCIQEDRGTAEELVAAIKPIIDAYVARFHSFPLDMREAIYRYLEMADFPDHEIRNQVMLLEQLYEKRYHRPLMDKEDSLFRLLNQVRNSEPEFARTITRLQQSYERQYRPGPHEAMHLLLERLRQPESTEQDLYECIEALQDLALERYGQRFSAEAEALRQRIRALLDEP